MSIQSFRISEAALHLSGASVETSRQAMKIGQRAYVTVTDSAITVLPNRTLLEGLTGTPRLSIVTTAVLHNLGNTPASVEGVNVEILPVYVRQLPNDCGLIRLALSIGPKDATPVMIRCAFVDIAGQSFQQWRDPLTAKYQLSFSDVFNDRHTVSWHSDGLYRKDQLKAYDPLEPPFGLGASVR
jgi:hypothetical protein